jgi:D-aminopeptidase
VGVLVQSNYGGRGELRMSGVPVGAEMLGECLPTAAAVPKEGSIIVVAATSAPLLPHQLKRLARRATMGVARMGSYAGNGSGDIFIAFSTANSQLDRSGGTGVGGSSSSSSSSSGGGGGTVDSTVHSVEFLAGESMDGISEAVVQATEEAICNALCAADTTVGLHGRVAHALPHDRLREILAKYGRLGGDE